MSTFDGPRPSMQALFSPDAVAKSKSGRLQRLSASLSWRQRYQTAQEYSYEFNDGDNILSVSQVSNGELKGLGTGTFVWPAAHVLAKFLEKNFGNNNKLIGARVCEIGSGTGLTGLVAANLGAEVYLTDQAPLLSLLKNNVDRAHSVYNSFESKKPHVCIYDWGNDDHIRDLSPPFDILLISDCVLPKLYPIEPLIRSVDALLGNLSVAYFSYEHRHYPLFDPRHEFYRLAANYGLHVEIIPCTMHDDIFSAEDIEIWEVRRTEYRSVPLTYSVMNRVKDSEEGKGQSHHSISSSSSSSSLLTLMESSLSFDGWGDLEQINAQMQVSYLDEKVAGKKKSFMVPVTINQFVNSTTGCYLWPSSAILSRYLLAHHYIGENGSDKSSPLAIDLGAGCGLTTMTLLMTGFNVIATDKEPSTDILRQNLSNFKEKLKEFLTFSESRDNNSTESFCKKHLENVAAGGTDNMGLLEVTHVDWTQLEVGKVNIENSSPYRGHSYADIIVCSDCLYASSSAEALVMTLESLCGPDTIVYLCNQLRSALDEFLSCIRKSSYYTRGQSIKGTWDVEELLLSQSDHTICRNINGLVVSPPLRLFKMKFIKHNS